MPSSRMILERAVLDVRPGHEADFLAAFAEAEAAPGAPDAPALDGRAG